MLQNMQSIRTDESGGEKMSVNNGSTYLTKNVGKRAISNRAIWCYTRMPSYSVKQLRRIGKEISNRKSRGISRTARNQWRIGLYD